MFVFRVSNVQVVLHEAEIAPAGHRNQRRRRPRQQDIDKPKGFQDTGEHPRVLYRSVGWWGQKVCTDLTMYYQKSNVFKFVGQRFVTVFSLNNKSEVIFLIVAKQVKSYDIDRMPITLFDCSIDFIRIFSSTLRSPFVLQKIN